MKRTLVIALALLTAGLAGCIDGSDDDVEPQSATDQQAVSLERAPQWEVGDWWLIQLDRETWDEPVTVTRVVAEANDGTYTLGVPVDEWNPRLAFLHLPGLGAVSTGNLSFDMHDRDFRPVDFPLTEGKTWQTTYDGGTVNATVREAENGKARIHYCCSFNVSATYDVQLGALESLDAGDYGYEVLEHGSGYEGTLGIPTGQDLVFLHFAAVGAFESPTEPTSPVREVEVAEGYDRLMLGQIAGPFGLVDQPVSSVYVERANAPDGTTYQTTNGPTETTPTENVYELEGPGGTWTFEHVAPGPGLALSEGVAYDWVEVELGSGSSSSAQEEAASSADPIDGVEEVRSR